MKSQPLIQAKIHKKIIINKKFRNSEHNHQIWGRKNLEYEGEGTLLNGSIMRRRPGWKKPRSRAGPRRWRDPGRVWEPRPSRVTCLGSSLLFFYFFFPLPSLGFLWYVLGCFLIFIRVGNRVLDTQFPCGRHVEKYATLDHIRP